MMKQRYQKKKARPLFARKGHDVAGNEEDELLHGHAWFSKGPILLVSTIYTIFG